MEDFLDIDIPDAMNADPLAALDRLLGARKRRKPPAFPAYSDDELTSLTDEYLAKGANALQYVGETLDKPGRAVRGVIGGIIDTLAGEPEAKWGGGLLNLLPFSDAMGLTDPKQSVEGRDILEKLGAPTNQEGFFNSPEDSLWDVGGFATEVLLDPLTYTGIGKLTKEGVRASRLATEAAVAASKAGNVIPDLVKPFNEAVKAGERSLLSFGIGDNTVEWAGSGAGKVADLIQGPLDWIGDSAIGRGTRRIFSPQMMNMGSEVGQDVAPKHYGLFGERKAQALTEPYTTLDQLKRADRLTPEAEELMRQAAEGILPHVQPGSFDVMQSLPVGFEDVFEAGTRSRGRQVGNIAAEAARGLDVSDMTDNAVEYAARYHHKDVPGVVRDLGDALRGKPSLAFDPRLKEYKDFRGGAVAIDDIVRAKELDSQGRAIWDMTPDEAVNFLKPNYVGLAPQEAERRARAFYARTMAHDQNLYDVRIAGQDAKRLYNANPLQDEALGVTRSIKKQTYGDMVHEMVAKGSKSEDELMQELGGVPVDMVEISDALNRIKLNTDGKGLARSRDYMQQLGIDPTVGGKRYVPKEVFKDMNRLAKLWQSPEELGYLANVYDAFQNVWKTGVTSLWPSFHVRNLLGGLYYNWDSGANQQKYGAIMPTFYSGKTLVNGEKLPQELIDDMTRAMIDPATGVAKYSFKDTSDVIGGAYAQGVIKGGGSFHADTGKLAEDQLATIGGVVPRKGRTILEAMKEGVADALHKGKQDYEEGIRTGPTDFQKRAAQPVAPPKPGMIRKGVAATIATADTAANLGGKVGNAAEDSLRLGHYISQILRGMTPSEAAASVRKWFFEYSELTEVERNVFRRILPFYCVPEDSECLTRDGWKTYDQIEVGEDILTYNTQAGCTEWQPCLEVASFEHDQDLMVLENAYHKLRFTPNHRWVVQTPACKIKRSYGEYSYPARTKVVTGEELNTHHNIVCAAPIADRSDEVSFLTVEQARLLGWMVTDGYCRWRGASIEALVYQSPKKFLKEVTLVAGGTPRKPHPQTGVVAVPVLNHRAKEIEWSLRPENLAWTVCHLSREAAEAMYDAMYKGDGTVSEKRSGDFLAATKPHVRDAFLILCAMLGKRTGFGERGICVNEANRLRVACMKRRMERYTGIVWCPRTQNGTWVMRQGRLVTITGNTWSRKNTPLVLEELFTNPGGKMAQSIRASNEARDSKTYVPEWVGGGGPVVPLTKEGKYLTSLGLPWEGTFNWNVSPVPGQTLQRNLETTIASMNTIPKTAYVMASGRDPYTGRELRDLYPFPTNSPRWNALIGASPISKAIQTVRKSPFLDDRQTWPEFMVNSLTGVKTTNVSGGLDAAREREAQKVVEAVMRNNPEIRSTTRYYVDPKVGKENASQSVYELMRMNATIQKKAKERQKQRLAAEAAAR